MPFEWLIVTFLAAQLVLVAGKIVLVTGFIEAGTGLMIEWIVSILLLVGLLLLGGREVGAWGGFLAAAGGGVYQLLVSLLLVRVGAATVGFGEDDVPLSVDYPLIAALLLFLVAFPLATRDNLLAGSLHLYLIFLGGLAASYGIFLFLRRQFPDEPLSAGVLYLLVGVLIGAIYLMAAPGGHGNALILAAIHTGLAAGLVMVIPVVGYRILAGDLDTADTSRRAAIVLGIGLLVTGVLFVSRLFGA